MADQPYLTVFTEKTSDFIPFHCACECGFSDGSVEVRGWTGSWANTLGTGRVDMDQKLDLKQHYVKLKVVNDSILRRAMAKTREKWGVSGTNTPQEYKMGENDYYFVALNCVTFALDVARFCGFRVGDLLDTLERLASGESGSLANAATDAFVTGANAVKSVAGAAVGMGFGGLGGPAGAVTAQYVQLPYEAVAKLYLLNRSKVLDVDLLEVAL